MLRVLVLLLVLANGAYWAWTQGALATLGLAPAAQREPQRVAQQIHPEALKLLSAQEVRRLEATPVADAAAPKPTVCLLAGLFDDKQAANLQPLLGSALPAGSWQLESGVEPARWLIYMGKYPNADALNRKKTELRQINVKFDDVPLVALQLGLSLGSFGSQAEATQVMNVLSQRGVRTARVVQERSEQRGQYLRLPAVDDALRAKLDALKPQLQGKALRACE